MDEINYYKELDEAVHWHVLLLPDKNRNVKNHITFIISFLKNEIDDHLHILEPSHLFIYVSY